MANLLLAVIYVSFVSLGLPDSLLGAAWPSIYPALGTSISSAGILSMIIAVGTVVSSLLSDRVTRLWGAGKVNAFSVLLTAVALFGFSTSGSFGALCLWAIPYGLGAGAVDAALNNYVALHYKSRHMSWLHCMWGIGATLGPYAMGYALSHGMGWTGGYRTISLVQFGLVAILFASLPLWKRQSKAESSQGSRPLPLRKALGIAGAKEMMLCFFCYSAVEQTTGLWAASYLNGACGFSTEISATFAGLFFVGITVGRILSGFMTMRLSDDRMIRLGIGIIACGIVLLLLPVNALSLAGLVAIGLGCAPIYPCIIHSTPARFGAENSLAFVGIQMASAYVGTTLMPPLFGLVARNLNISLLPAYLILFLSLMFYMHSKLTKITRN